MIKLISICLLSVLVSGAVAQGDRNVLTERYSRGSVRKSIPADNSWVTYPGYKDRDSWEMLPAAVRSNAIRAGERYLGYQWSNFSITEYLAFTRTGDREVIDTKSSERQRVLRSLVMAELMEGKGRFMDDIVNGVFSICEQTYWGKSAHFYLYGYEGNLDNPTTVVPDADNPIIDLGVGDMAADLAWTWYFFHESWDKISPVIGKRVKGEIAKKVLVPYYTRNDFWWMFGWQGGGNVNNWNPWVNYNILACILLLEDDPGKRWDGVYKCLESIDVFINGYPADGSCSEGPSYWNAAVARLFSLLNLLHKASGGEIDVYDNDKLREMVRYVYRVYISQGKYYTNYADAPMEIHRSATSLYKIGKNVADTTVMAFAAFLHQQRGGEGGRGTGGRIGEQIDYLFNPVDPAAVPAVEPLIPEFYFPDWEVAIARDKPGSTDGFYFTAKGGNNQEQHNHNDVGSFMLYFDGEPVLIDAGVGTYTRETFGKGRYGIWTMQSDYHNVPVINGVSQQNGAQFKAIHSAFASSRTSVRFSTDIAKAYPAHARVKTWTRSYTLERNKRFIIHDRYELAERLAPDRLHFLTKLKASVYKPGKLRLSGSRFDLELTYDAGLMDVRVETIAIEDAKLQRSIGSEISRIVFTVGNPATKGDFSLEISKPKKANE